MPAVTHVVALLGDDDALVREAAPKARESTATIAKPGLFQSTRSPYRISCNNVVIQTPSSG
jgi:hypothetical protein